MIEKLAALYKQGLLDGEHFNSAVKRIAVQQMEKKAYDDNGDANAVLGALAIAGTTALGAHAYDKLSPNHEIKYDANGAIRPTTYADRSWLYRMFIPNKGVSAAEIAKTPGLLDAIQKIKPANITFDDFIDNPDAMDVARNMAYNGMEKKAFGASTIKKWISKAVDAGIGAGKKMTGDVFTATRKNALAPTAEGVGALVKRIGKAMTDDDIMKAVERMDFSLVDPILAAGRAGGTFEPLAESIVRQAARARMIALSAPAASIGESVARMHSSMGTVPLVGLFGAGGLAAAKGVSMIGNALQKRQQDGVIRDIILDNKDLDPGKAIDNFRSLQMVAPDIAGDKAIASGFIKRMNEFDTLDLAPLESVAKIQDSYTKKWQAPKGFTHFDSAIKDAVGGLAVGL